MARAALVDHERILEGVAEGGPEMARAAMNALIAASLDDARGALVRSYQA